MKYNLRSASSEQQTNELSAPLPDKAYYKTKLKMKDNPEATPKRKKVKKAQKVKSKSSRISMKKKSKEIQSIQQGPLHDSILRFPLKYKKKTLRVYCYKESDLQIKKRFTKCYGQNEKDDDKDSSESLIEAEVQRCKKDLFESVRKYQEAKLKAQSEAKNELEASTDDSNKSPTLIRKPFVKKQKRRISKRQKSKRNKQNK